MSVTVSSPYVPWYLVCEELAVCSTKEHLHFSSDDKPGTCKTEGSSDRNKAILTYGTRIRSPARNQTRATLVRGRHATIRPPEHPTTHLNNTCEVCTIFVSDYCIWIFHGHLLSVLVLLWEDSGTSVNVLRPCPLSPKQFATKQQQQQQQQMMSYLLTAHQGPFAICRWCQQPLCYGLPLIWIFGTKQRPLSILMFHQCCSLNKTKRNISEGGEGGPEERHEGRGGPEKRRDREEGEVQTREEIYCRRGGGIEKRRHREVRGGPEKRRDRGDGRSREEKR